MPAQEQTLFGIIGPSVWPPVWAWTEDNLPALSYYIATALVGGGIFAMVRARRPLSSRPSGPVRGGFLSRGSPSALIGRSRCRPLR